MENSKQANLHYGVHTDTELQEKQQSASREAALDSDIPPGLSERDVAILRSVKSNAHKLDAAFHVCCFRFGWAFLISFVPIIGDIVVAFLSYYLITHEATQADLPPSLARTMLFNNIVGVALSFIPLIGDILIGIWKVNLRNAGLLEEFLRIRGEESLKSGGQAFTV